MPFTNELTKLIREVWQEVDQQGESFIQVDSLDDIFLYRQVFRNSNGSITLVTKDWSVMEDWFESEQFDDHHGPEVRLVEPDGNGGFLLEETDPNTRVNLRRQR